MSDRTRLHDLDNLRAFVVLLVIVLHAAITYMTYTPEWWYVLDPDRSDAFLWLVLLVDVPLMPIMFFMAGFFATPSLQRRGPRGFVREKAIRLALPWAIGVIFLAPLETYMTYVSRGIPTGYLQFWTNDFWGPLFQQSVYWFLGVLLIEFMVLVYAYLFPARALLQDPKPAPRPPTARLFVGFVGLTAIGSILASPAMSVDDWRSAGWLLVFQPARVSFYAGFFMLGILAERRGWLGAGGDRPRLAPWLAALAASAAAYLFVRLSLSQYDFGVRALTSVLFAAFCLSALLAGIAVFGRWINGAGPVWRRLAANSFGIYYLHPLILYPLAYLVRPLAIPAVSKFAILVAVTAVGSLAASALVLKRLPGLRRMF